MRSWARDPLVHFLLAGLAVFGVHHWLAADGAREITITPERVEALEAGFRERSGREATVQERAALIDDHARREALFREGLALELDRGDPVVRRRIVQKMELLLTGGAPPEPDDAALSALLAAEPERYQWPATHAFEHVFVATRRDRDGAAVAAKHLAELDGGADPGTLGEPFPHGRRFDDVAVDATGRRFGDGFSAGIAELPTNQWGVVRSDHGWHVVRVERRTGARAATLEEVRDRLRSDWQERWRQDRAQERTDALMERYRVELEEAP